MNSLLARAPLWAMITVALLEVVLAGLWTIVPNALKYDGPVALLAGLAVVTGGVGALREARRRERERLPGSYLKRLESAGTVAELIERAIGELVRITGTDYNQVMLKHHLQDDLQHYSVLVVVGDSIAAGKQQYRLASFDGLVGQVAASG